VRDAARVQAAKHGASAAGDRGWCAGSENTRLAWPDIVQVTLGAAEERDERK